MVFASPGQPQPLEFQKLTAAPVFIIDLSGVYSMFTVILLEQCD